MRRSVLSWAKVLASTTNAAASGATCGPVFSAAKASSVLSQTSAASTPALIRTLWASPNTLGAAELLNVLSEEISHETSSYVAPAEVTPGPPAPFTLTETNGDTLLTLTRKYNDETINVDMHVNNQPAAEVDESSEEETLTIVVFNVSVNKGPNTMVFECESDGTYVAINHIAHEPKDGIDSDSTYTGPVFDELDENLQNEFRSYIHERGVNNELGEYLRHLIYDKEQREYTNWLKKVEVFVK